MAKNVLSAKDIKRLNKFTGSWIFNDIRLGDRIQNLTLQGTLAGSGSQPFIADTGGVDANDIIVQTGYDSTTGLMKMDQADADTEALQEDLYWTATAVAVGDEGTARKSGHFVSTLSGTIGDKVYLSATAGEVTLVEPSGSNFIVVVGSLATTGATGRVNIDLASAEKTLIHTHASDSQGGTVDISATDSTTFTVDDDTTHSKLILSAATAGSSGFDLTIKAASIAGSSRTVTAPDPGGADSLVYLALAGTLTNKTLTTPTIGSFTNATHDHSNAANGGTLASIAGLTGTTNISFETYTGTSEPSIAISGSSGGTGNFTQTIQAAAIVTSSDATLLLPNTAGAGDTFVMKTIAETLANKTLTAPTINAGTLTGTFTISGSPTISGTWANLGTVTTVDINGGTVDGAIIGGSTPAAGAFTTLSSSGATTAASIVCTAGATFGGGYGTTGATISTAGVGEFNGALTTDGTLTADDVVAVGGNIDAGADGTAGTVDIFPSTGTNSKIIIQCTDIGAGSRNLTITNAAQAAARTYTIPDAGASADFVMDEGSQTIGGVKAFTGACTFLSVTGNNVTNLAIAAKAGAAAAGAILALASGAGGGSGNDGGAITITSGIGVAEAGAGSASDSGAITIGTPLGAQSVTGTPGASGAIIIQTGTGGLTVTSGNAADSGDLTVRTGTGGEAQTANNGGDAGTLALTSGDGGVDTGAGNVGGAGGPLTITAGDGGAGGTQGGGGDVTINAGDGDTAGSINIGAGVVAAIGIGKAGVTTTITGQLDIAAGDHIEMAAGTGYFQNLGGTSGGIKILPIAIGTAVTTIQNTNGSAGTLTLPLGTDTLVARDTTDTLTNKTLTTPVLTTPQINTGSLENGAAGAASTVHRLVVRKNTMADGVATAVLTVTCPNVAHAAALKVTVLAMVDDQESARCAEGMAIFSREAGSNLVGALASLELAQIATGGTETLTLAYSLSAAVGAVGDPNTMDLQFTIDTNAASDGEIVVLAELINGEGTGITVAGA